ncbi:MAG: phosphate acyltransferase PlsX [Peptostreptococcaceae bacterium]|nr:phosphate acyltransferase PlsX [Peptostreptococcaceae bacterium]
MKIMIDGMGGDYAPQEIVKGAVLAAKEIKHEVIIIGEEDKIHKELKRNNYKGNNITVVNATEQITNEESPVKAIRKKKDSSIVKGFNMIKESEADVFISAGSTGALLAGSLLILGRIKGIDRPAIAAFYPKIGKNEPALLLDCGANTDIKPKNLLQFGIMGSIYIENVLQRKEPEVGLLNIGIEPNKGDKLHKEAYVLLEGSQLNFIGNVEGRDVPAGACDVIVADGFSGNIFLKTSEGMASSIMKLIKTKLMESILSKMGALLTAKKLRSLKKEFDYSESGGAPILGVKGVVLKLHGSSKSNAVYNAILKAIPYVEKDLVSMIENSVKKNGDLND